ncbi:MAG: copper resistance protein NlpE N-terminal domain-containing protein [Burkholderiales bacterium]|jgi:uncharacterized lipoprotein NlpE involved in copper resistance|nr:copper resistance protein NlpE N-terminal domain-containing protein [Burkholderiales bacterium]
MHHGSGWHRFFGLIVFPLVVAPLALAACASNTQKTPVNPDPAHNSRNAIDWAGTYEGVTPCADCPGIKLRLTLRADGRYELTTQYLDRQPTPTTVRGSFTWDAAGSAITLDSAGGGQQFRVGEGRLLQMNRDGTAPAWNTPGRVLTRVAG